MLYSYDLDRIVKATESTHEADKPGEPDTDTLDEGVLTFKTGITAGGSTMILYAKKNAVCIATTAKLFASNSFLYRKRFNLRCLSLPAIVNPDYGSVHVANTTRRSMALSRLASLGPRGCSSLCIAGAPSELGSKILTLYLRQRPST